MFIPRAMAVLAVLAALGTPATPAQAGPLVTTTVAGAFGGLCCGTLFNGSAVIGSGAEFIIPSATDGSYWSADFDDLSLTLGYFSGSSPGFGTDVFWQFELEAGLRFANITELQDSFGGGAELVDLTGGKATFLIHDQANTAASGYAAVYSLAIQAVPEPGVLSLAMAALLVAGLGTRRHSPGR